MRSRNLWAGVASAVLVAGVGAVGASAAAAASADPASSPIDCFQNTSGINDRTFTGAVGDTFTVTNSSEFYSCFISSDGTNTLDVTMDGYDGIVTVAGTTSDFGGQVITSLGTATFTIVGSGSFTIVYGPPGYFSSTITVVALATPGPDLTPWLQAYARSSQSEQCATGYAPSYAEWPNGGKGGWVCEKTTRKYLS